MPGGRRWGWLALVVGLGAVAVALTVLPRPPDERAAAALLAAAGLAAGFAAGLLLAARPALSTWRRATRPRTGPEWFNEGAFAVVLLALWILAVVLLGRWGGLLTGVVVGLALAAASRTARVNRS